MSDRVIAVTSGKGGVGKTSITVNLGYQLISKGQKVLLIDGDFQLGNMDVLLGIYPEQNLSNVIQGKALLEEVIVEIEPGLHVLPASSGDLKMLTLNNLVRRSLIGQLEEFVNRMDTVLIDTGAGLSEDVLFLNGSSDQVMIVTTPEPTALSDAYAMIKVLKSQYKIREFSLFVNMVENEAEGSKVYRNLIEVTDRFLQIGLTYLGCCRRDELVSKSIKSRMPFVRSCPFSAASRSIDLLSDQLKSVGSSSMKGGLQMIWRQSDYSVAQSAL
jgi:flagellar biosynthesis protein FlhG